MPSIENIRIVKPTPMTVDGYLFQARLWREYAMSFDGLPTCRGITGSWIERNLGMSREECLRRARAKVLQARRLNKQRERERRR